MLSLLGKHSGKFCDGLSRRSFLTIGSLGIAGATLFHQMGISPTYDRAFDLQGRPQYPVYPEAKPLPELI